MKHRMLSILLPFLVLATATSNAGLAELLDETGDQPGPFVVHLNCGDGEQTAELLKRDGIVVQGLDTDRKKIETARRNLASHKAYGQRITFNEFDGRHLPFVDNCVNTIVANGNCQVANDEILRVLAPRGVAVINGKKIVKPWPDDIDEWTHHMHGPDNNRVANDSRIKPRLSHLQWTAGPRYTRHHEHMSSFQAMVSAQGKVFYIIDEGLVESVLMPPSWYLVARDAFNGIELWRIKLDNWFSHLFTFKSGPVTITRRLVAQGDLLYAVLEMGGPVSVLDANTGKVLGSLPESDEAEEIIVDGDRLYLVSRGLLSQYKTFRSKRTETPGGVPRNRATQFNWAKGDTKQWVKAFDLRTRKRLWEKKTPVTPFGLATRNGKVYVLDGERVFSLEGETGKTVWTSPKVANRPLYTTEDASCLVVGDDRVVVSDSGGKMTALSVKDGSIIWAGFQYKSGRHSPKDLFLIDGKAWTASTLGSSMTLPGAPSTAKLKSGRITGYDLETGKVAADFYTESEVYMMNSRCHMSCATTNYLITSRTGAELVSLEDQKWNLHHWVRGACLYGLMPANGILYAPPNPCGCYSEANLDHFNAVTGENPDWEKTIASHRNDEFISGVKMAKTSVKSEPDAWPTYRHNNLRSGATDVEVKLPLKQSWRADGYENLTAPVVAQNRCFFAEKDRHILHALDAETGEKQWSYVAGGRIDSPPTVYGGSVIFGCADGWLYKLRVSDGALVWQRRIAPANLSLFNYGQPVSVWPLFGSVLVQDGKIYTVAGRSMFLDGGLRLVVLDAETGSVLHENVMNHLDPNTGEDMHKYVAMQNLPVALPDILSSDGKNLYMRSQQFDLTGKRTHLTASAWDESIKIGIGREHVFSPTGFLDDNWYHRSYWVYGNGFMSGCSMPDGGWFEMSRISPAGKMICFDDEHVYGYGQSFPEYSLWSSAFRYTMFSMNKKPKNYEPGVPDEELREQKPNWRKYRSLRKPTVEFDFNWKEPLPVRAKALLKTSNTLFLAGPEDVLDEETFFDNPYDERNKLMANKQDELIRSRTGGKLAAVSDEDGVVLQEIDLASQPVWDGMAAAYGKLFMSCKDGSVVAYATTDDPSVVLNKRPPPAPKKAVLKKTNIPKGKPSALKAMGGKISEVSSFNPNRPPEAMTDGNPRTFWHTRFVDGDAKPPHYVVLEVPDGTSVTGLAYTAWTGGKGNGHVKAFAVSVSGDGKNWTPVCAGKVDSKMSGRYEIVFPKPTAKPFIKFEVTAAHSPKGRFLVAIGELDVLVK